MIVEGKMGSGVGEPGDGNSQDTLNDSVFLKWFEPQMRCRCLLAFQVGRLTGWLMLPKHLRHRMIASDKSSIMLMVL